MNVIQQRPAQTTHMDLTVVMKPYLMVIMSIT